jgi:sugar lactone lactonase YvrE
MARPTLALTLAATLLTAGCGDPVVVLGDWPGYMRVVLGVAGSAGMTTDTAAVRTRLFVPYGVAAAADGSIYVGDQAGRIIRVTPAGRALDVYSAAAGCAPCLQQPEGMAVDSTSLYVADPGAGKVWRVSLQRFGEVTALAGNGGESSGPDGPALSTSIAGPAHVVLDATGRIYFSERRGNRVRRLDADGTLHSVAGTGAAGFSGDGGAATSATLNGPSGLALQGSTLFIADAGSQRVRAVDLSSGIIRTVAGTGVSGFTGDDGPATAATLATPQALAATPDGRTLYIADQLNRRIRSLDLTTGVIRTFAGTGGSGFGGAGRAAAETALPLPIDIAVSPYRLLFVVDAVNLVVWRTPLGL